MIRIYGDIMEDIFKKEEIQPQNMYIAENIDAMTESKLRLPGGKDRSRWYSLGSQSTVPFVQFIGGGAVQKIFTWGEMVEVPAGQEVLVKSACLMRGDIIIEAGRDVAAKPRRITIPVTMLDEDGNEGPWVDFSVDNSIVPEFPCDTRNCHEAYLDISLTGGTENGSFIDIEVQYDNIIHTFTAQPAIVPVTAHQWAKVERVHPNTHYERIPLGISQTLGNWASEPASLLDKADLVISNAAVDLSKGWIGATGFYVLNY